MTNDNFNGAAFLVCLIIVIAALFGLAALGCGLEMVIRGVF